MKTCNYCSLEKPLSDYQTYTNRKGSLSHFGHCRDCNKIKSKKWKLDNPERTKQLDKIRYGRTKHIKRDKYIEKTYGLSPEAYATLYKTQNGLCSICEKAPKDCKSLDVDHCHITKKVRGLLCNACNQGLGFFKDNPSLLQKAISYLSSQASLQA